MFEAWHPEAMAENTPKGALRVRRLFEFHFLPQVASVRLLEVKSAHVRKPVRALIDAGKVCSGQLIPDTALSFSSATAGASPSLN